MEKRSALETRRTTTTRRREERERERERDEAVRELVWTRQREDRVR